MLKIRLAELKALEQPLSNLMAQKVPVKTSFKLSKVLKQIADELELVEAERQKLIREFGEEDKEKESISITDPAKLLKFQMQFKDFLNEEVELNFTPFSIDLLGDDIALSVQEVTLLSPLFTE